MKSSLATMAKIKAMVAENKSKKDAKEKELQETRKDLADYQGAIAVLKKNQEEAQKAKAIQAKAEAERKELEEAKRQAEALEVRKQREWESSKERGDGDLMQKEFQRPG
jgi:hypothetical protein